MAVGASKPTVIADADGFFSVKSKMLVSMIILFLCNVLSYALMKLCQVENLCIYLCQISKAVVGIILFHQLTKLNLSANFLLILISVIKVRYDDFNGWLFFKGERIRHSLENVLLFQTI